MGIASGNITLQARGTREARETPGTNRHAESGRRLTGARPSRVRLFCRLGSN